MYPELLRIGPVVVNSYGVMLALSFILGISLAVRYAEKRGISGDTMLTLGLIIMISSIVGARLFYILFHLGEFRGNWKAAFLPVQPDGTISMGGLILLGGFILAVVASTLFILLKKLPFWKLADSVAPSLGLGIFLTRIGCFLNGCCFGKACDLPWAVKFPPYSPAGATMGDALIHPTQLYSSLYGLIIFLILFKMEKRGLPDGFLFGLFLVMYGIARFTVDFFRYYESQMFVLDGLDFNQVVSLVMFFVGSFILYSRRSRPRQASHNRE